MWRLSVSSRESGAPVLAVPSGNPCRVVLWALWYPRVQLSWCLLHDPTVVLKRMCCTLVKGRSPSWVRTLPQVSAMGGR